jgi:hypothetical protein
MARTAGSQTFNILIVGQSGRLSYEAIVFLASLRAMSPDFSGKIFVAEPQPGPLWEKDPTIRNKAVRELIPELGGTFLPFESRHFGQSYVQGNKIEALMAMPKGEPFLFLDTDTLVVGDLTQVPFDFSTPSASLKVEGTWPTPELYGPGYTEIWKSLYDRFRLDFESSLDMSQPDEYWRRYLYFNAGFFYFSCPHEFGQRFLEYALAIRHDAPEALICQSLDPWLDQIALPLVIHSFGGGRTSLEPGFLDGSVTCHYRMFPLLYARESDHVVEVLETVTAPQDIKKVLKQYDPIKFMIYHGRGQKVRAMFDRENLPRRERAIRNQIRKAGFWMR